LSKHRKAIAIGLLALIGVDGLQLIVPKIIERIVDDLARGAATADRLWILAGGVVAVYLGMGLFRFGWRYFIIGSSHRIARDLRQELYDHLQSLSPQYYDRTKVGDIMAHATNDVRAVQMATGMATLASFDSLLLMVASITIMISMNLKLTLLSLIPLPVLSFAMLRFGKLVHRRFTRVQEAFSSLSEKTQESLSGVRVIKAYGDERSEIELFSEKAQACADENISLAKVWGLFMPIINGLAFASLAILLGAGGRMVIRGTVSLGQFVAFSNYLMMLIWPMMAVGWVVNMLQRGTASMKRLQKILQTPPDVQSGKEERVPDTSIRVENLSFTYPGTEAEVLSDVSFSLPSDGSLGIVGRTGAGKTTLVEVMMRMYDPPPGTIFVGGEDVTRMDLEALRGMFGYVPQETFLFAMSVLENLRFGHEQLPPERVKELARTVDIHDEIVEFPDGYDTLVGERGVSLSGGQKQRVAIARALAVNPSILVLDDALSNVDTETEAAILDRLGERLGDRTNIIIAHRISTVQGCDLILVLDGGRLVESGTHDGLMALDGFYAELYRMQQLEEEAMDEDGEGGAP
jgi:ATP-binding cassette subfamily B protein